MAATLSKELASSYLRIINRKKNSPKSVPKNGAVYEQSEIKNLPNMAEYVYGEESVPIGLSIGEVRKNGELTVLKTEPCHCLTVGATGSGKSQGFCLSNIINSTEDETLVVTDAKGGELVAATYLSECKKRGANNVHILNLSRPEHSTVYFNQFSALAKEWLEAPDMLPEAEMIEKREEIEDKLRKTVETLFPIRTQDASWDIGARGVVEGIFHGLITDTEFNDSGIRAVNRFKTTPDDVNFNTVNKVFSRISWESSEGSLGDGGFFSSRPKDSAPMLYASTALKPTSSNTRSSYMSQVSSYLMPFRSPKIRKIMQKNTLDIKGLAKKGQILYIVYDICDSTIQTLLNIIIKEIFNQLIELHDEKVAPLDVPVTFLLDEFPQIKPDPIYASIVSYGRGLNIYLTPIIQSLAQLESAYPDTYNVFLDNCSILFLSSNSYDTCVKMSNYFGRCDELDLVKLADGYISTKEKNAVSVEKLLQMECGEGYFKAPGLAPIHTGYELAFRTPEYCACPRFDINTVVHAETMRDFDEKGVNVFFGPGEASDEEDDEIRFAEMKKIMEKRRREIRRALIRERMAKELKMLTLNELERLLEIYNHNKRCSVSWMVECFDITLSSAEKLLQKFEQAGILHSENEVNYMLIPTKRQIDTAIRKKHLEENDG